MAKNAENAVKKQETNFFGKAVNWFKNIGTYLKEVFAETKKLTWPTKKELINYTIAVIAFVALMALVIWVLDLIFSNAISALAKIKIGG